jgi:hypothetical protein
MDNTQKSKLMFINFSIHTYVLSSGSRNFDTHTIFSCVHTYHLWLRGSVHAEKTQSDQKTQPDFLLFENSLLKLLCYSLLKCSVCWLYFCNAWWPAGSAANLCTQNSTGGDVKCSETDCASATCTSPACSPCHSCCAAWRVHRCSVCACVFVCLFVYMYAFMCVFVICVHTHTHTVTHTHAYCHIHIHIHIGTHTHIHIRTHAYCLASCQVLRARVHVRVVVLLVL